MNPLKFFSFQQLANLITLTRIIGVGFIFWITPYHTSFWLISTVLLYILICVTDFLDGWVARRFNLVTDFGKVLDPLADKILVLVFLPLLEMQAISSFPVFIILAREFAIMAVRIVSAKDGTIIAANLSGKIKTAITFPIVGILFARVPVTPSTNLPLFFQPFEALRIWIFNWPYWVFSLLIWTMVAVTIWSFIGYVASYIWNYYLKNKFKNDRKAAKKAFMSLIPNSITFLNFAFGILAIVVAFKGLFHFSCFLILAAILCDALDGKLARKLDVKSEFGAQMDTIADAVSFGLAPAAIILNTSFAPLPFAQALAVSLALTYLGSVFFRLYRFSKAGHSSEFEGLPSPIGAAFVVLASISALLSGPVLLSGVILVGSGFMASTVAYPHLESMQKYRVFRFLRFPAGLTMGATLVMLIISPEANFFGVYDLMLLLMCAYVLYPMVRQAASR